MSACGFLFKQESASVSCNLRAEVDHLPLCPDRRRGPEWPQGPGVSGHQRAVVAAARERARPFKLVAKDVTAGS